MDNYANRDVKFDVLGPRRLVFLSLAYVVLVIVFVFGTLVSPDLLHEEVETSIPAQPSLGYRHQFRTTATPEQQVLFFTEEMQHPTEFEALEFTRNYNITIFGSGSGTIGWQGCKNGCLSCPSSPLCDALLRNATRERKVKCWPGQELCTPLLLATIDFIKYKTYFVTVDAAPLPQLALFDRNGLVFTYKTVNVSEPFTRWKMGWSYTLFAVSTVVLAWFCIKNPWRHRSRQQHWIVVLLVCAVLLNDPLLAARIYNATARPLYALHATFTGFSFSVLLFFWLELFELTAADGDSEPQRYTCSTFPWAKLALVCLLFILNVGLIVFLRTEQSLDPSYTKEDVPLYGGPATAALRIGLFLLYFIWLAILAARSVRHFMTMSLTYKCVFALTLWTAFASLALLIAGGVKSLLHSSGLVIGSRAVICVYVWLLAYGYCSALGRRGGAVEEGFGLSHIPSERGMELGIRESSYSPQGDVEEVEVVLHSTKG